MGEPLVHSIRQVSEVDDTQKANDLLEDGYTLLSAVQDPHGRPWFLLGRDSGPRTIRVQWSDDAVEGALERLTEWRDGSGNGPLASHDQTVLVAIDCLRTVLGKED